VNVLNVLLFKASHRSFYIGSGRWAADQSRAITFSGIEDAVRCNLEERLDATDIVLLYANPPRTVTLPITSSISPVAPRRRLIPSITCV
jgi:hypothetical protein